MSSTTTNLSLFKYDTVADAKSKFNIDTALNDNFDKIDTFAGNVNANKANIDLSNLSQTGQGVLNAKQNASTAVKHTANTAVGSASQPVYIDANGNAVAGNSIPNTTSSVTSGSNDALTSGGAYTNLVKRYSTSSATGGTNTPVYVDSTGKVQSCGSSIESTRFDGQWVSSVSTLSTATAVGTYTIDLSSYLPNDNYNYEVFITTMGNRTNSSGNANIMIYSDVMGYNTNVDSSRQSCASAHDSSCDGSYVIIPVKRYLYSVINTSAFTWASVCARGYRRIGSNS
jgi:hypothetical protein